MSWVRENYLNCAKRLREERAKVFKAFDVYKQNVAYGLINESEEEHSAIIAWYNRCLDLDRNAIENPPAAVKRYY